MTAPPLSVVIPVREGFGEIEAVLEVLLPQAERTGAEILVVGRATGAVPDAVRFVPVDSADIFRLRLTGVRAARGAIVAIGEDHAVPTPDWCERTIAAHAAAPDAPAIAGCLRNATDKTLGGRVNFLSFAAPFQPPMPLVPASRPPPVSVVSFKREALAGVDAAGERFEIALVPRLVAAGTMLADDSIVIDHYQDHPLRWVAANAFHGARASYGYGRGSLSRRERWRQARWSIEHWPRRVRRDARPATGGGAGARLELVLVAGIGIAVGLGAALGSLIGPGVSPQRVA